MITRWTPEAVRGLGVVTDLVTAGELLGLHRTKTYELARTGNFPVRVLKLGNQYRVPTAPLLDLLGLSSNPAAGEPRTLTADKETSPVATELESTATASKEPLDHGHTLRAI